MSLFHVGQITINLSIRFENNLEKIGNENKCDILNKLIYQHVFNFLFNHQLFLTLNV